MQILRPLRTGIASICAERRAIREFARFSSGAELAVVYYSGHGQSDVIRGIPTSFLLPADYRELVQT